MIKKLFERKAAKTERAGEETEARLPKSKGGLSVTAKQDKENYKNNGGSFVMKVGVAGLGLIGGSAARAYTISSHEVLGYDLDESIVSFAELSGVLSGRLDEKNIGECDLILIAIYPQGAVEYFKKMAPLISANALVIDLCGTKRYICKVGFELAERYGFTYVGGHPMAGTHRSGFKASRADLFKGAPMVIVPPGYDDMDLLTRIQEAIKPMGFGSISVTTASHHDKLIAFTSQLAHVVSSAYIKSPTAREHMGFSAGSYKDLTRVARLNPEMWAQLFLENVDNLTFEIENMIENLEKYKEAISSQNKEELMALLEEGSRIKEELDPL